MDQWHTLTRFRCSWVFPGARKRQRAAPSFKGSWWNFPTGEIYSLVFSDLWISLSTLSLCYSTWCHSYSIQPTIKWKNIEAMADGANVVPQSLGLPSVHLCHCTVLLPKEQPWNMKDLFYDMVPSEKISITFYQALPHHCFYWIPMSTCLNIRKASFYILKNNVV